MKILYTLLALISFMQFSTATEALLKEHRKILFLGDSITQGGKYVANFEAWLVKKYPDRRYTVINAGLSSETISGLSEDGHAGGNFPRPCLFERLERVLAKTNPDLIIACYGMNCGIYLELDDARFDRYKNGAIRLRAAAKQYGAEIVHVTPPIFDNNGKQDEKFHYDKVLAAYAKWLVAQRELGWHVADLHTEMRAKVNAAKAKDPQFTVQPDRVHPNAKGHWMMAQSLIRFFGDEDSANLSSPNELLSKERNQLITKRMQTYLAAIHAETNPLRPKTPKKGTLKLAEAHAKELEAMIYK